MLIFDKMYALLIAIVFGLAGLPWGFWLFRKDRGSGIFEKTIIGYTIGLIAVPLLFLVEYLVGLLYIPQFVYVNWAVVFLSGAYFAFKDKAYKIRFDFSEVFSQINFVKLALFAIMLSSFMIGFSVSGTPIMDLDPYFYLDGVRQVVYAGQNIMNDMTAWYPLPISSHGGNPVWKYMLASWFSLYNGDAAYSPYTLLGVGSVYPPIIGALSAFFAYFLFKHLYNHRTGLLAAGLLVFLPVMMIKFQGGDFQIEPYNIFAFVLLMSGFAYALLKNTKESWIFMGLSAIAAFLGSNLASLVLFVFSLIIFVIGISKFVMPTQEGERREKTLGLFVVAIIVCELILAIYNVRAGNAVFASLKSILPVILIPAGAFAAQWVINRLFGEEKNELSELKKKVGFDKLKLDMWSRIGVLGVIVIVGLFVGIFAQHIPVIGPVAQSYILFGAYTEPLYRTIAEQAPGSEFYNGQLGFLAAPFSEIKATGTLGAIYNLKVSAIGAINAVPNAIVNLVYGIFIVVMNSISGFDTFQKVDKGNSMLTLLVFWGTLALIVKMIYSLYKKQPWSLDSLLILPFIVPVILVAFGKAKLVMYLALAAVFLAAVVWANFEKLVKRLFSWYYAGQQKKMETDEKKTKLTGEQSLYARILRWGAICVVLLLVLVQFAPAHFMSLTIPGQEPTDGLFKVLASTYGYGGLPFFINSFTPRIYDAPDKVLTKLERYCALSGDGAVCSRVQDWENTTQNPVLYYEQNLCARSLWPYVNKAPDLSTQVAISYRCSMVSSYWLDSMQWINENVPAGKPGSRIISWWDYGHWINYFGEKNTVLRNEHASTEMIGRTAAAFLHKDAQFLRETMKKYDSRYLLVDIEILGSGADKNNINLGGKYSALNYLGCAWANKTDVERWPGQSACENEHLWETVVIPQRQDVGGEPCTISADRGINGVMGYKLKRQASGESVPEAKYCFTQEYENGQAVVRAYYLDKKDSVGDLKASPARWVGYNDDNGIILNAFYDGEIPQDAGAFYHSNVYNAFFRDEVEGFELVYSTPQIRIFRMTDEYWN